MNARACLMLTILAWGAMGQGAESIAPKPALKPAPQPAPKPALKPAPHTAVLDFNRDVAPILSGHCYQCHGPDKQHREAGLRLDRREQALKPADSGSPAIVPGKPSESELVRRIFHSDADERMPPPHVKKDLTAAQKEILQRWIAEGAPYQPHWSFVPPRRPTLPEVKGAAWVRNPIDRFVLARLEPAGLQPSPQADHSTLMRRVYLDLTGLPPTLEEQTAFQANQTGNAYEPTVDRLMATRAYAERRTQDWLDLARYADSNGFADDKPRNIWPYRDWVIRAFQSNMRFDQFTIEQLAGDLLPQPTTDQRLASAFHRNAPQAKGVTYPEEEYRLKGVADRVNTTGAVWLGLTLSCAECHDHKFDPISQRDYYALFALFNNIAHQGKGHKQDGPSMSLPAAGERKPLQVPVMQELSQPRDTFVHVRGNFLIRGEKVSAAVPALFEVPANRQPRNRLEFARWLVDGGHPLVARVVVNRIWQGCFGYGLVRTSADFGVQGALPTHPELLDWLAVELVESGWDMRHIHRLIVTSATYRQSARITPELLAADPGKLLLARASRPRLAAEQIRDQALAVSGLLVTTDAGGPGLYPRQPENYWEQRALPGQWTNSTGKDQYRRSLYTYWRRMALHPSLELFDAAGQNRLHSAAASVSNVPTQALVTLNDPIYVEASAALARRLLKEAHQSDTARRLELGFRLMLARQPDEAELARFVDFVRGQRAQNSDEQAIWTAVATVLLNLDESICRP